MSLTREETTKLNNISEDVADITVLIEKLMELFSAGGVQNPDLTVLKAVLEKEIADSEAKHADYLPLAGGTMSGNLRLANLAPQIEARATSITRNNAPRANYENLEILGTDSQGNATWGLYHVYQEDKDNSIRLLVYNGTTTDNACTAFGVGFDSHGSIYTLAPTPASTVDNSTQIATTAWVRTATGDTALNAATATNATNDKNGHDIAETYLPLTGGTVQLVRVGQVSTGGTYTEITGGAVQAKSVSSDGTTFAGTLKLTDNARVTVPTPASTSSSADAASTEWVRTASGNTTLNAATATRAALADMLDSADNPILRMDNPFGTTPTAMDAETHISICPENDTESYGMFACTVCHATNTATSAAVAGAVNIGMAATTNTTGNKSTHTFSLVVTQNGTAYTSGPSVLPKANNQYSVGNGSYRWTDVFATNGTINTSDERLKTGISAFPDEVLDAWGEVNFQQFQMVDAVAEKGSNAARLHAGVIAQRIVDVFQKHGLDARRYGLLCYDSWEASDCDERVLVEDAVYRTETVIDRAAYIDENGVMHPEQTHTERIEVKPAKYQIVHHHQDAGSMYSVRYAEALCLEAAYQRRCVARLTAMVQEQAAQLAAVKAALRG